MAGIQRDSISAQVSSSHTDPLDSYSEPQSIKVTMKTAVILFAVLALALAAPQGPRDDSQTTVVRYVNDNNGIDNYHFT